MVSGAEKKSVHSVRCCREEDTRYEVPYRGAYTVSGAVKTSLQAARCCEQMPTCCQNAVNKSLYIATCQAAEPFQELTR